MFSIRCGSRLRGHSLTLAKPNIKIIVHQNFNSSKGQSMTNNLPPDVIKGPNILQFKLKINQHF